MIVKVQEMVVNGNKKIQYVFGGEVYDDLRSLLRNEFKTQGDFYGIVMGVTSYDAELAGWHPTHKDFTSRDCDGWKKFLADRGKIKKEFNVMEVDIRNLLFDDK